MPAATLKLPHPELSVCVKFVILPVDVEVDNDNVLLPGNVGGDVGTNLPSTWFNCAILFVTDVVVVNVTALLVNAPAVLLPSWIVLPRIEPATVLTSAKLRLPLPSVTIT